MLKLAAGGLLLSAALAASGAPPAYSINGQVSDERGAAARGVRVCAYHEGLDQSRPHADVPCASSDAGGRFAIALGRAGRYRLFYDHPAAGHFPSHQAFFRHPDFPPPEVVVDDVNASPSVSVSMAPKNGALVGRGVDAETGQPIEHLDFILCHVKAPEVCRRTSAKNAEGRFRVPTPHVHFNLTVRAEGYDDWTGEAGADGRPPTVLIYPGASARLDVRMKRSAESAGRALHESEKRVGVHLPAPAQTAPADETVFEHYPRRTRLEWSPVEGAVSYTVEVDFCGCRPKGAKGCPDAQPHASAPDSSPVWITDTFYELNFVGAQPGRWRVWAIDREGREGFKSPWRFFVYLQ